MSERFRFQFCPAMELNIETKYHVSEEYKTLELAKMAKNAVSDYTLRLHKLELMPDYSNFGWIEKFENGEWVEIEEE